MDNTASIDQTMLALLSIFGGAALTVVAGFIGAGLQSQREHKKWLRERRFDAYERAHQTLSRMNNLLGALDDVEGRLATARAAPSMNREDYSDLGRDVEEARLRLASMIDDGVVVRARLVLAGPSEVYALFDTVSTAVRSRNAGQYKSALGKLEAAMRTALGVRN